MAKEIYGNDFGSYDEDLDEEEKHNDDGEEGET